MGRAIPPRTWEKYFKLRAKGWNRAAAARECGVSYQACVDREKARVNPRPKARPHQNGDEVRERREELQHPGPVPLDDLSPVAKEALNDFGLFQRRYFGRIAVPWQVEAANQVVRFLSTPNEEYVVINAPPGSGKSTTFTLDIAAWVTCRNRQIRGLIGSKTLRQAEMYTMRLRRAFERTQPIKAEIRELQLGLAIDATTTLADDFGRFKPEGGDIWSRNEFVVDQIGGNPIAEKEPTWSAFGMDTGFLGGRFDIVLWDDVVDNKTIKTAESRDAQAAWWDDIAETRLDPGGVLILQGQRMGAEDLYRYNLDKRAVADEDDDTDMQDSALTGRKYHHIVFKSHYEDRCEHHHRMDDPPWPEGCLLYPRRLPWKKLRQLMANQDKFKVLYQQEDVDPENVLIDPLWISGGTNPRTGEVFPGCWDKDRNFGEIPKGLAGTLLSVATADPSPTMYWSVQWWIYQIINGQAENRYLIDLERRKMDAPDFLDWSHITQRFVGVMQEWQQRSVDLGHPITTWIVEANAAQRFLLQYEHVRRWQGHWGVNIIPHQTQRNKSDPEFGVQVLQPHYKYGRKRLPQRGFNTLVLIRELTHYPEAATDDCVMADWMGEWNLPNLIPPEGVMKTFKRPTWLKSVDTYQRRLLVS